MTNLKYQIIMLFGSEKLYVKSANGIWYEVKRNKASPLSFDKIEMKKIDLYVYQQVVNSNSLLRKAEEIASVNTINSNKI